MVEVGWLTVGSGCFVHLVCYADETGIHDATGVRRGAEVAAVGGWVAWEDNWGYTGTPYSTRRAKGLPRSVMACDRRLLWAPVLVTAA